MKSDVSDPSKKIDSILMKVTAETKGSEIVHCFVEHRTFMLFKEEKKWLMTQITAFLARIFSSGKHYKGFCVPRSVRHNKLKNHNKKLPFCVSFATKRFSSLFFKRRTRSLLFKKLIIMRDVNGRIKNHKKRMFTF